MQTIFKKVIIFIQTDLQLSIAKVIIKKYSPDDVLILDLRTFSCRVDDKLIFVNLYGFKNIGKTFYSFKKNKIKFKCEFLIGNLITNYNSFFLISVIDYSKLILIDDGIGTTVILKNLNYYDYNLKYKLKNFLLKSIFPVFYHKNFKMINEGVNDISFYYTIYDFKTKFKSEKINIFKESQVILKNVKCFLGHPLIEYQLISEEKYILFLEKLIKKEGPILYYAHPKEYYLKNIPINGFTFITNDDPVEIIFEKQGIPEYIYSFYSSSLLNLKIHNPTTNFYYVLNNISITSDNIFEEYKNLMEEAGIKRYPITLFK